MASAGGGRENSKAFNSKAVSQRPRLPVVQGQPPVPASRVARYLKVDTYAQRFGVGAPTMELAGNAVWDNKNQIVQRHIQLAVRMQKMIGTVEHCYFIKMETMAHLFMCLLVLKGPGMDPFEHERPEHHPVVWAPAEDQSQLTRWIIGDQKLWCRRCFAVAWLMAADGFYRLVCFVYIDYKRDEAFVDGYRFG